MAGPEAAALVFSVVALNELAAPIAYCWALIASGEVARTSGAPPPPPGDRRDEPPAAMREPPGEDPGSA